MNDWPDIGKQLADARQKRQLSLQDVSHEIQIPVNSLKALEESNYSNFASPAYARSFLQQYSEYLKVDAHEVLDVFQTDRIIPASDGIEFLDQKPDHAPPRSSQSRSSARSRNEDTVNLTQPLLILLITGGLIAGGIWGFFVVEKRLNAEPPAPVIVTPPVAEPAPVEIPEPEPARPPKLIAGGTPIPASETASPEEPLPFEFSEDDPPPRAIIVEEDEE